MNPFNLYVASSKLMLQTNLGDESSIEEFLRYFTCLRQSLACCVCLNILKNPYGTKDGICQHHVCRGCIHGEKKLRPSCAWCKEAAQFEEKKHLQTLIQCFKTLCIYLKSKYIPRNPRYLYGNGGPNSLHSIVKEGTLVDDESYVQPEMPSLPMPKLVKIKINNDSNTTDMPNNVCAGVKIEELITKDESMSKVEVKQELQDDDTGLMLSSTVVAEHDYNKGALRGSEEQIKFKRRNVSTTKISKSKFKCQSLMKQKRKFSVKSKKDKQRGCRCGLATANPGKLTCCGQRCPCYAAFLGCGMFCRCRGCRNSRSLLMQNSDLIISPNEQIHH